MNTESKKLLNTHIDRFFWPNVIEEILKEDFHCYTIDDVLSLTAERIELQNAFLKKDIRMLCNTLISIDSELFYNSELYESLKNSKTYCDLIPYLNKANEIDTSI